MNPDPIPSDQDSPKRAVRLDWMTISIPHEHFAKVADWCQDTFGMYKGGKGGRFRAASHVYGGGLCSLFFDPPSVEDANDNFILDITGTGCKLAGDTALIQLALYALDELGGHLTRLDIAVDMFNQVEDLIEQVHQSCLAGHNCRFKAHKIDRSQSGSEVVGEGIYLGKRGKDGSGRSVCVYDKGLEQKQLPRGQWVRWEARYANDCACEAIRLYAELDKPGQMLLAFDAVDFRERTSETEISRRPQCEWWINLRQSAADPYVLKQVRRDSSASGLMDWWCNQVVPLFDRMRSRLGLSWDDFVAATAGVGSSTRRLAPTPSHARDLICLMQNGLVDEDGVEWPSVYEMLWRQTVWNRTEVDQARHQ